MKFIHIAHNQAPFADLTSYQQWYQHWYQEPHEPSITRGCNQVGSKKAPLLFYYLPIYSLRAGHQQVGRQVGRQLKQPLHNVTKYKPIYLNTTQSPIFLPIYLYIGPIYKWVTKMKPGIDSVAIHPQLSHKRHPMDPQWMDVASFTSSSSFASSHPSSQKKHTHTHSLSLSLSLSSLLSWGQKFHANQYKLIMIHFP